MKIRFSFRLTLWVLFALIPAGVSAVARAEATDPESGRFLLSVQRFADTVLQHGLDTYGPLKTPLFVDGLHVGTLAPVIWKGKDEGSDKNEDWVLCNFASQQALMRTLDGLTSLTGQTEYRRAAESAAGYALKHLVTPNGMLYWGGHMAWDLELDKPVGWGGPVTQELKYNEPYYDLMWRVTNPFPLRPMTLQPLKSSLLSAAAPKPGFGRDGKKLTPT